MGCYKAGKGGKCTVNGIECSGEDSTRDCFMELEHEEGPERLNRSEMQIIFENAIDRLRGGFEKLDNALISNVSVKADFLQLKKDFDVLRNRCNNVLSMGESFGAYIDILKELSTRAGFYIVMNEKNIPVIIKKAAKRKARPAKKAVKKVRK